MAGKCKDCRFYDGKKCGVSGATRMPTSGCGIYFASYTVSQTRTCKDCRFYDGKKCEVYGSRMPNSTCGTHFSPYR